MIRVVAEMIRAYEKREERARWRWLGAATAVLVAAGIILGWMQHRSRLAIQSFGELAEVSGDSFTEGVDAGILAIGVPLPSRPLEHWKKPPCGTRRQRAINDACWVQLDADPGDDHCGEYYEYDGRCWAPIAKPRRAPQSIQR